MTPAEQEMLQAAIGVAYTLERELGRGGMATVYLAHDNKHQRLVAIKILHADSSATLGPDRFRREVATAGRLQHPHVLGVFDSGETSDGRLWFTMPFVDGETLRARLKREIQLSVEDALRIVRELAGALDYAHLSGVIHRDIKPENVLLTKQGDALLADFGIAQALESGVLGPGVPTLTATGASIGTPQYMSPEQASGQRTLDARSDVYALGAVFYETLAGEPPFTGPTAQAIIARMLASEPPSICMVRPAVSSRIDGVLRRALEPIAADRWKSAGEFSRALDETQRAPADAPRRTPSATRIAVMAGVLALVIAGVAVLAWRAKHTAASVEVAASAIRLVVLPFENQGDSADGYFAEGMTEAVHDKLANVPGIEVIGTASARQYRGTTKSAKQIGEELGVRYILEGRVRWAKESGKVNRVRVSPELVDVGSSTDKWAQPFDAPLTDVFQVQSDIAGRVAQALQITLTAPAQAQLASRPTSNLLAYDAFLRAQGTMGRGFTPTNARRAITLLRDAATRDPGFALAWSSLGRVYAQLFYYSQPLPEFADSADQSTARGLKLAPGSIEAHASRALYLTQVRSDYAQGLAEAEKGLANGPNAPSLAAAATAEEHMGRWDAAAEHAAQAVAHDPRDSQAVGRLVLVLLRMKRSVEAAQAVGRALAIDPESSALLQLRALTLVADGDLAGAHAAIRGTGTTFDSTRVVAFISQYREAMWTMDSAQLAFIGTLRPDAFDADTASWALVLAQSYVMRGNRAKRIAYADTARMHYVALLRSAPDNAFLIQQLALSLALAGRSEEAIREGRRAVALLPLSRDANDGPETEHSLALIYAIAGENDHAMDLLDKLLKEFYYITPAYLAVDPTFAELRGDPRFERMIASGKRAR
ncbi:MAG: protein kinase [Gemmatimonadota bacterium]